MQRPIRPGRLLLTGILAVAAAWTLAQPAAARVDAPTVPGAIQPPAGHKPFLEGHAVGVQIYSCAATPTGHSWAFVAPRANLYKPNGRLLMTHYAGPSWEAKDGSKVVGSRVDGVTVDAGAIPWLLLSATAATPGPDDGDRLADTTYIQRIATTGGLAPAAAGCSAATAGTVTEVPYTADYVFWKAQRR